MLASPSPRFEIGDTIILREVFDGRVRSVRPLRVVTDADDVFAGYLVPDSKVAWPRLADGEQSQTPDQGWLLGDETWFGPGSLYVIEPGESFAAVLFFDRVTAEPVGWKVDFFEPVQRTELGFDTLDHALDLLAEVGSHHVEVKDRDDLAQLTRTGQLGAAACERLMASRNRAVEKLAGHLAPFDDRWEQWRPDPTWSPLVLPDRWTTVEPNVVDLRAPEAPIVRSGSAGRVLDEQGRVLLDLDLDDGRQILGQAHPDVIAAVSRQLSLGWSRARHRPGEQRLRTLIADWAGAATPDQVHLATHHDAIDLAWRLLSTSSGLLTVEPRKILQRGNPTDEVLARIHDARDEGARVILDWRSCAVPPSGMWADLESDAVVLGSALGAGFDIGAVICRAGREVAASNGSTDLDPLGVVAALEVLGHLPPSIVSGLATTTAQLIDRCRAIDGVTTTGFGNRLLVALPSDDGTVPPAELSGRLADHGLHLGPGRWIALGADESERVEVVSALPAALRCIT